MTPAERHRTMASLTPQQMRALADDTERLAGVALPAQLAEQHNSAVATALRTAADQLEAVRAWLAAVEDDDAHWSALDVIMDGASSA